MEQSRVMSEREEQEDRIKQLQIEMLGAFTMFDALIRNDDLNQNNKQLLVEGLYQQFDNLQESVEMVGKFENDLRVMEEGSSARA